MVYGKFKKGKEQKIWQSGFVVWFYYFSKLVADIGDSICEQKHEKKAQYNFALAFQLQSI